MYSILIYAASAILGIYLIAKGADWVTDSLVPVARRFGTSNLAVGLILVSMLLSLPEIIVAIFSIFSGHTGLAIGLTIGSVVVNIGLVVGLSALIRPLRASQSMLLRDGLFMVIIAIITVLLASDLVITPVEGIVFLLLFVPYIVNVFEEEKKVHPDERAKVEDHILMSLKFAGRLDPHEFELHSGSLSFVLGGAMLTIGAWIFADALVNFAMFLTQAFSTLPASRLDFLIGMSIGAIGPSIPNIAAGINATRRGYEELAVSETIGSNIFTLLITLGLVAVLHPPGSPLAIDAPSFYVNSLSMLFMSFLLILFMHKGWVLRRDGLALVLTYLVILCLQIIFALYF